jgi:hypothetical protein
LQAVYLLFRHKEFFLTIGHGDGITETVDVIQTYFLKSIFANTQNQNQK